MKENTTNARVYWATEENFFEMEIVNFDTIQDANNYLAELAEEVGIEVEGNTIEGVDEEGYTFYAYAVEQDQFAKIERELEEIRESAIEEDF